MKALAALRTAKVLVKPGEWHTGNIAGSEFPLSHVKKLRLGKAWHWCVYRVADDARDYRLLVAFEPAKKSVLGVVGRGF